MRTQSDQNKRVQSMHEEQLRQLLERDAINGYANDRQSVERHIHGLLDVVANRDFEIIALRAALAHAKQHLRSSPAIVQAQALGQAIIEAKDDLPEGWSLSVHIDRDDLGICAVGPEDQCINAPIDLGLSPSEQVFNVLERAKQTVTPIRRQNF